MQLVLEYVCRPPPPMTLPSTFVDQEYSVKYIEPKSQKSSERTIVFDKEFIRCTNSKSGKTDYKQLYRNITNVVQENSGGIFILGTHSLA